MAEGGDFYESIVDGSDIVYEFVCTPCKCDGSILEAFHFCQICDQYLCNTCTKYHQRLQKNHQLQPTESMKDTQRQTATTKQLVVAKCHIHPDRDVEMYCGTHDMVYCCLCIAKEHRICNNVEEVRDGVHKPDASRLQQVAADIDRGSDKLKKLKRRISNKLKQVETRKPDLLKEIDNMRKKMNDHLDQLERKIKAELDEEISNVERDIRDGIDAADDLLITAKERKPDTESNKSDKHMFIEEKLGAKVVSDVNAFIANTMPKAVIKFEHNSKLYYNIKMENSFGKIIRCLY